MRWPLYPTTAPVLRDAEANDNAALYQHIGGRLAGGRPETATSPRQGLSAPYGLTPAFSRLGKLPARQLTDEAWRLVDALPAEDAGGF